MEKSGSSFARLAVILAIAITGGLTAYAIMWLLMTFGTAMIPGILMGLGLLALITIAVTMMVRMSR